MDLDTNNLDDYWFSILNSTYIPAEISVVIFPEGLQRKVIRRKITGTRLDVFRTKCLLTSEQDPATTDIAALIAELGIPADSHFAVRFISSLPVIISHKKYQPAYHSGII